MITNRENRINTYIQALRTEIALVASIIGKRKIGSLHFGGGTPNMLSESVMRGLFDFLRESFDFSAVKEIAMELDPRMVSRDQTKILAAYGVTRVSLGVQDFDCDVQAAIGRIQPYDVVAQACHWLRTAGIYHINFDLIYGLPKQTPQTVADTAARACDLHPDRIALFSYAHVPQIKKHQQALEIHGIPDLEKRLVLDQVVRSVLLSRQYYAIGIDHFTMPEDPLLQAWRAGKLCRNFQGYTEGSGIPLLGFGASSISQTCDGYFQNELDARVYQAVLRENKLPIARGFLLSLEDRVRSAIIEKLMCNLSCDIENVCLAHNYPPDAFAHEMEQLKPYEDAGLIARKGYALCLTTPHRMAVRVICSIFDDYTHRAHVMSSRTA